MASAQTVQRIERILASPFWQDASRKCVVEKATIEIIGRSGAYRWHIKDAIEQSDGGLPGPFATLEDAKSSAFTAIQDALRREREQLSTQT